MMTSIRTRISIISVLGLFLAVLPQERLLGQTTAFTYQGRLNDSGSPANGLYDLSFALYLTNSGGSPAGILTNTSIGISNGLFTTLLDFGPVFGGQACWLEMAVRPNGSTNDFSTLSPRQYVSPTPYSLYAQTANGVSGVVASSNLPPTVALLNTSPTFSGAITASAFIGDGAALTNINNAALYIPALTNGQSTTVNLSSNLSVGDTLTVKAGTVSNAFSMSARNALPTFPVPVLRPTIANSVLAFDLMPNGSPKQYGLSGITWFDVCNADILSGNGSVAAARVGINTNWVFFGSMNYNGATMLPVVLGINELPYLILDVAGNITVSRSMSITGTNSASYASIANTLATKGFSASVRTITSNYTATANDFLIRCDTSAGGFTVTLPPAAGVAGQVLNIKKVSADANTLTIDAYGAEMIDGTSSTTTMEPMTNYQLMSDGTGWNIL
jgi:hypothetical protein